MASVCDEPNGRKRIEFGPVGARKRIRLGKATENQAQAFKLRIEKLESARILGNPPDDETARWVVERDDVMHGRIAATGLVKPRGKSQAVTLGAFIDGYIADRSDAKPRTIINLKAARKDLCAFFGEDKPLNAVTVADAGEFWRYLLRRGLGSNTARRICGRAKQFFGIAIDKGMFTANPFRKLKTRVESNQDRKAFVDRKAFAKVLDACPSTEWKLIFALCRYGGFRCPSEVLALKWQHVNFEAGTMLVRSTKTEHHEGGGQRLVPLFAELKPLLWQAYTEAPPGTEFAVGCSRDGGVNLRTQAERIIERAGVTPWPKLFQNMRASRATELAGEYPSHVCAAWLGHTEAIADEFYRQVRDEDFQRAVGDSGAQAAHNAAQQGSELGGMGLQTSGDENKKAPVFPGLSIPCGPVPNGYLPPRGVEPLFSG